jgi:CubicO group peptidase (beta-lactamase class C family)
LKTLARIALIAISLAATIYFVPWNLLGVYLSPLPDTVQEQVEDATRHGLDGILVYVERGGQEPVIHTAGWKDRAKEIPADPAALFKIASITKLYVAATVTRLADRGVLDLDQTLDTYLPDIAARIPYAERVTLRMLVQHRSGIPNYNDVGDYDWFDMSGDKPDEITRVYDLPPDFEPGSGEGYSNTNYLLIGRIMEAATGKRWEALVREEILRPLELERTVFSIREVELEDLASGYMKGWDGDLKELDYPGPAGAMIAPIDEVGVFLRALNNGSLLSETEQVTYSDLYRYGHTGLLPGYSSIARYHPDIDAVVIQFVNTSGGDSWSVHEASYNRVVKILRAPGGG